MSDHRVPEHRHGDAVRQVTHELAGRHRGVLSRAEVQDVVRASYEELSRKAWVTAYLPVLARSRAEGRLPDMARERSTSARPVPTIVFICQGDEDRSQIAAALLDHHAQGRVDVRATGTTPAVRLNPVAVSALAELGVTLAEPYPEPPSDAHLRMADVVVTLGAVAERPDIPGARYLDWDLPDHSGNALDEVRGLRDELDRRARSLLSDVSDAG